VLAFPGQLPLLAHPACPSMDGAARWWPRTGTQRDVNLLQMDFAGVPGNPSDYFVIVTGSTEGTAANVTVRGQVSLKDKATCSHCGIAEVRLRATGSTPDPHRLSVDLFRRRRLLTLPLPPIKIATFGVSDVELGGKSGQ
jgi:hypothetical protein